MGLFSGKNFSFKNVITMPFDIAKNDAKFFGNLVTNPKDAFGEKQRGMTKILGGVGFNEDHKINKNSDAIMGVILGGIAAGGAMGAGAGAGASGGAGATGGGTAAASGASTGAATGGGAATSGSWLNNPYVQQGQNLLQQRQQAQQQAMASVQQNNQVKPVSAARYAQQEQQGYSPYGKGGLLG